MPENETCFLCHKPIDKGEPKKRFERQGRQIMVHQLCISLLLDMVRSGSEETKVPKEVQEQPARDRILALVQRDADGLFVISSKKVYNLAAREAVALVLYVEARPLSMEELAPRLKRCYKEIPASSLRVYLTSRDAATSIRIYVNRTGEGYELNSAGIDWFETNVAPKIL